MNITSYTVNQLTVKSFTTDRYSAVVELPPLRLFDFPENISSTALYRSSFLISFIITLLPDLRLLLDDEPASARSNSRCSRLRFADLKNSIKCL